MADKRRSVFRHDLEVIKALHARYVAGEDPDSLAAEIGISRGAMLSQFHHKSLGGKERRHWWSVSELNLAKQRIMKGVDIEVIARQMGVREEQLYRALLKWGFSPTPYTSSSARVARRKEDFKIFSLRQKGMSYAQIAREFGWSDDVSGQRRIGRRIKAYCDKVGIPIPLVDVVLRRDGTRRRVGYGPKVREANSERMAARMGKDYT